MTNALDAYKIAMTAALDTWTSAALAYDLEYQVEVARNARDAAYEVCCAAYKAYELAEAAYEDTGVSTTRKLG